MAKQAREMIAKLFMEERKKMIDELKNDIVTELQHAVSKLNYWEEWEELEGAINKYFTEPPIMEIEFYKGGAQIVVGSSGNVFFRGGARIELSIDNPECLQEQITGIDKFINELQEAKKKLTDALNTIGTNDD